jgi:proteasome accessory factor A
VAGERLFGVETEYGFAALRRDGTPMPAESGLGGFMNLATRRLPHLGGYGMGDLFLTNGARLYVDCGGHPEFSTPECGDPKDVVRYILAGDRILSAIAADFVATSRNVSEAVLLKTNVDYQDRDVTWGCHESYLHKADPRAVWQGIVPHLVSRIVYTGAGGFNPRSEGLEFTISPRAWHLRTTQSDSSTEARGIVHTKDESLCGDGYHRLHLICGESLCSETAMWLRTATTALVVAMIEAGVTPGKAVALGSPVKAVQRFAGDPTCTAKVKLRDGRRVTALEIQRHYLEMAEGHIGEPSMPAWTSEVLGRWREILERLERGGPGSVATTLDWAVKYALYRNHVRRRCTDPADGSSQRELRDRLCEIDVRFGQLGDRGIFAAIDRAGALDHHVVGVDRIEEAVNTPPDTGRARLRGEWVRRFADKRDTCHCSWESVWDGAKHRFLDLSDPFQTTEHWVRRTPRCPEETTFAADEHAEFRPRRVPHRVATILAASPGRRRAFRPLHRPPEPAPPRTAEGFGVGDRLILLRPHDAEQLPRDEWVPEMDACVGHVMTITGILQTREIGQSLVSVASGQDRQWTTRTRLLRPLGGAATMSERSAHA